MMFSSVIDGSHFRNLKVDSLVDRPMALEAFETGLQPYCRILTITGSGADDI